MRIISGDFAGYAGKLEGVHTQDGLKRAAVLLPWSPEMGQPARDRLVWVRPAEIEVQS